VLPKIFCHWICLGSFIQSFGENEKGVKGGSRSNVLIDNPFAWRENEKRINRVTFFSVGQVAAEQPSYACIDFLSYPTAAFSYYFVSSIAQKGFRAASRSPMQGECFAGREQFIFNSQRA
jgi:hypothetical protein